MSLEPIIYNGLEEAGNKILNLISKMIDVNTFCFTKITKTESYFVSVLNRNEQLAEAGITVSVYDAY